MGLKGIVGVALAVLAALVGWAWATRPEPQGFLSDLLVNFASEAWGFILTVFLVNFLLRRHHLESEARQLARAILNDVDHAVWVWLGGKREFGVAEGRALLGRVEDGMKPARFTESLLIGVGGRAANVLRTHPQLVERRPALRRALEGLVPLAGLRDGAPGETPAPSLIAGILLDAVGPLCEAARMEPESGAVQAPAVDASPAAQRWRHSGEL